MRVGGGDGDRVVRARDEDLLLGHVRGTRRGGVGFPTARSRPGRSPSVVETRGAARPGRVHTSASSGTIRSCPVVRRSCAPSSTLLASLALALATLTVVQSATTSASAAPVDPFTVRPGTTQLEVLDATTWRATSSSCCATAPSSTPAPSTPRAA